MFNTSTAIADTFRRDERGAVALLFGLSSVALMMIAGLAFDVGRAVVSNNKITAAVDAAALAAAKSIRLEGLTDAEAIVLANKVFQENMRSTSGNWTTIQSVNVTIDRVTSRATVTVDSSVKSMLGTLAGVPTIANGSSASALFESRDIEVAVQLDLTGSMCSPCSKLTALKGATKDLVDILIPSTQTAQKVRVAFAPFSAGVNVGPYLRAVDGNRASANTCVYERQTSTNDLTDAVPLGNDAYKIRADLGGGVQACPAATIEPLTSDRDYLKSKVDGFRAVSSTAGQLGAAWAWNLLSPNWQNVWPLASRPVAYNTANTDKVVILMTDGVYNTIGGVNFGDNSAQAVTASNMSVELCTNMKQDGIIVYTVGFDLDSIGSSSARTRATDTLIACAGRTGRPHTDYDPFFYKADDDLALRAAFNNIATSIMRLRLTN